jgi:hypothetical protein
VSASFGCLLKEKRTSDDLELLRVVVLDFCPHCSGGDWVTFKGTTVDNSKFVKNSRLPVRAMLGSTNDYGSVHGKDRSPYSRSLVSKCSVSDSAWWD